MREKTKKHFGARILAFLTALALIVGLLPMGTEKVSASTEYDEIIYWGYEPVDGDLDILHVGNSAYTDPKYNNNGCISTTGSSSLPYNFPNEYRVVIDNKIKPESTAKMFELNNMVSIEGLENLDTTVVTDMNCMFKSCLSLTELILPDSFDTSSVTNMNSMFCDCYYLEKLKLPDSFDTSAAMYMNSMFDDCMSLTELKLPDSFNTSNVTDMKFMFNMCKSLTELKLPDSFDTSEVTDMNCMFGFCQFLKELILPDCFITSKVTDMSQMFAACSSLIHIYASDFDIIPECITSTMFLDNTLLVGQYGTGFDFIHEDGSYACLDTPEKPGYFSKYGKKEIVPEVADSNGNVVLEATYLNEVTDDLLSDVSFVEATTGSAIKVSGLSSFINLSGASTDIENQFIYKFKFIPDDCENYYPYAGMALITAKPKPVTVKVVAFDRGYIEGDTSVVLDAYAYDGDDIIKDVYVVSTTGDSLTGKMKDDKPGKNKDVEVNLKLVNYEGIDSLQYYIVGQTENVTVNIRETSEETIYWAFEEAYDEGHGILYLGNAEYAGEKYSDKGSFGNSTSFDYDRDDNLNSPWSSFSYLIDKVVIDTPVKLYSTKHLFEALFSLKEIENLKNLDTSDVTDMSHMFSLCASLESLDLSSLNTSKVKNMSFMFKKSDSLKNVNLLNFDTRCVEDMAGMFDSCAKLQSLDLSKFDTRCVENMYSMFNACESLKKLDLSNFDTSKVQYMNGMFNACSSLETIDFSSLNLNSIKETGLDHMFCCCKALKTIYAPNADLTDSGANPGSGEYFMGCTSLTGENGTTVNDENSCNIEYFRIDREGAPGFFTTPRKTNNNSSGNSSSSQGTSSENGVVNTDYSSEIPVATVIVPSSTSSDNTEQGNPDSSDEKKDDIQDDKKDDSTDTGYDTSKNEENNTSDTADLLKELQKLLGTKKVLVTSGRPSKAVDGTLSDSRYVSIEGSPFADCFIKDEKGNIKFIGSNGKSVKSTFVAVVDEKTGQAKLFYLNQKGNLVKNKAFKVNGKYYYAGRFGRIVVGKFFRDADGKLRYAYEDGSLAVECWIDRVYRTYHFNEYAYADDSRKIKY